MSSLVAYMFPFLNNYNSNLQYDNSFTEKDFEIVEEELDSYDILNEIIYTENDYNYIYNNNIIKNNNKNLGKTSKLDEISNLKKEALQSKILEKRRRKKRNRKLNRNNK